MSKVDQLRALREQRYKEQQGKAKAVDPQARKIKALEALAEATAPKPEITEFCEYVGLDGRTCIRAKDHEEKYHKYGRRIP